MVERLLLTMFLVRSQEPPCRATQNVDKQRRAYAALQLRTTELQHERHQLRADLSTLQTQVAALMADREGVRRLESTMADYVTDDLTVASDPPLQCTTILTPSHQVDPTAARRPHRSIWVTFSGDPEELAFFLIEVGSYMEVHGAGFQTDQEQFLLVLRLRFEDPLTEEKARASLQRLRQGTCSVSDFAAEFRRLASHL
uniref:Uncharacterized protein n=1 Tax=Sphaerodactylus townsendi TaxID=933632 RepID=A0ACB8ERK6_9SAUR